MDVSVGSGESREFASTGLNINVTMDTVTFVCGKGRRRRGGKETREKRRRERTKRERREREGGRWLEEKRGMKVKEQREEWRWKRRVKKGREIESQKMVRGGRWGAWM